jgi:hypothetical protein
MFAWATTPAGAAPPAAQQRKAAVDPAAIAALERMAAFLRGQQAFEVTSETTTDDVWPQGKTDQKVQVGSAVSLKVRRPNRLRVDVASDRKVERLLYDGNLFTVYQPKLGYYAQFAAPPTLLELVGVLESRYGVDLPLADLFRLGTDEAQVRAIRAAALVGYGTVRGAPCAHYAFRQPDLDWEVWIEEGAQPVPRKLVITTTSERSQPQFTAVMTWTLGAKLENQMFAFTPPPNARRIEFAAGNAAAPQALRQGRAAPRQGGKGGTP